MPQVIALMVAGAGLYKAAKWLTGELSRHAEAAQRQAEAMRAKAEAAAAGTAKDLGALEYDAHAKVYRPAAKS